MSKETKPTNPPQPLTKMLKTFLKAQNVGIPLLAIRTFDNNATISSVSRALENDGEELPIFEWDVVRGFHPFNAQGKAALKTGSCPGEGMLIGDMGALMMQSTKIPDDSIVFVHNAQMFFDSAMVRQGICNCRDDFKLRGMMLVLLSAQFIFPTEFQDDITLLEEELPTPEELQTLVRIQYTSKRDTNPEMPELSEDVLERSVDGLAGLSFYPAETALMLSLSRAGIDLDALWERKRKMIEQTPGLSIYRGKETFDDVAGLENVKNYARRIINGKRRPRAVVWLDELEKQLGGLGVDGGPGDTSGITQDQLDQLLQYMQEKNVQGLLFNGFAGSGKSLMAKVIGGACGVPTIRMDLGAMKTSLVGDSQKNIRQAIKIMDAVGRGEILLIATSNMLKNMPPEIRRRFKRGTFFFDLPTTLERISAWELHAKKHGLDLDKEPVIDFDEGWTGAEIETCVEQCVEMDMGLLESAQYVTPICRSMAGKIEEMRNAASGAFNSASYPGTYEANKDFSKAGNASGRRTRAIKE